MKSTPQIEVWELIWNGGVTFKLLLGHRFWSWNLEVWFFEDLFFEIWSYVWICILPEGSWKKIENLIKYQRQTDIWNSICLSWMFFVHTICLTALITANGWVNWENEFILGKVCNFVIKTQKIVRAILGNLKAFENLINFSAKQMCLLILNILAVYPCLLDSFSYWILMGKLRKWVISVINI